MRAVLATVGTRGDVQPMLALAQALTRAGHQASVACPATFKSWVEGHGIEHHALGEDLSELMRTQSDKLQRSLSGMREYFKQQLLQQAPRLRDLARGADAIVSTAMAWSGPSVAEALGIAALMLLPSAGLRSRLHPPPLFPLYSGSRLLNRLLWWLSDALQNRLMGGPLNEARKSLGLPPVGSFTDHLFVTTPVVLAADELLMPPDPAWNGRYPYTGFLFLDDDAPLSAELDAWLAQGEPPICINFGSMAGAQVARAERIVAEALQGRRCLVIGGAAGLFAQRESWPSGFFAVPEAPHARLFPRVSVVLHHGGAGTMAAALRAGVPQVVTPVLLDQFHHAHHLVRMELSPRAPKLARLTAPALRRALDEAARLPAEKRQQMAERVRKADAGRAIVQLLEQRLARPLDADWAGEPGGGSIASACTPTEKGQ